MAGLEEIILGDIELQPRTCYDEGEDSEKILQKNLLKHLIPVKSLSNPYQIHSKMFKRRNKLFKCQCKTKGTGNLKLTYISNQVTFIIS